MGADNMNGEIIVHSEVQTATICHICVWQKTMDLKVKRADNCRVTGIIQKLVCPWCGEEKWEEVE